MDFPLAGSMRDDGDDCTAKHMREIADRPDSDRIRAFVDLNVARMAEDFKLKAHKGQYSALVAVDGKDDELMALVGRLGELGYAVMTVGKGVRGWTISVDWSNA